MNILFHSNQLGLRGTEVALYDYAYYGRQYIDINPIIVSNKNSELSSHEKFSSEFEVVLYDNVNELARISDTYKSKYAYFIKAGSNDGIFVDNSKSIIHSVFQEYDPHGYVYGYVSEWLSLKMTNGNSPYVPHMISILDYDHNENLREYLGISDDCFVYGYYGGRDSFNIDYVKRYIHNFNSNRNIKFVFMNIDPFTDNENAFFLDGTFSMFHKISFINTCDACLHARYGGESFGLTIGEFSMKNKPIVTCETQPTWDNNHIYILGSNAILYNQSNIDDVISDFAINHDKYKNWNFYSKFSPEQVIDVFNRRFLI